MIVRDFVPRSKKDIIRIKILYPTQKKRYGKVVINAMHHKSKHNVKVSMGLCDLKEMIKEFEKDRSKLRK